MKKRLITLLLIILLLPFSACSNTFIFKSSSDEVAITYNDNEYTCVSTENCEFQYEEKDMVYLNSLKEGEFSSMGESYNVYRHTDDKDAAYLFVIPKPSIRDMTPYAFVMKMKTQPTATPTETCAPGEFSLQSIIDSAERHMTGLAFSDIPSDELKYLYPGVAALPVEVLGRRAEDGTEYLLIATTDTQDLSKIPNIQSILDSASKARATALSAESKVVAGGFNKYGALVCAKKGASELVTIICNTFTGHNIDGPSISTSLSVTPSPSPTITATATPVPNASSPSKTLEASAPSYTAKPTDEFTINGCSASDSKYIYYYSDGGVRRMDKSGKNDQRTNMKSGFDRFISINTDAIYYLAIDINYRPECENDHGQTFHSYNLMMYNLESLKVHTIYKHLYSTIEADNKIYMLNHEDHSRVIFYDIKTRKIQTVNNSRNEKDQYKNEYLQNINNQAYICLDKCYPITDDSIGDKPVEISDSLETSSFYQIEYGDEGGLSLWTGSEYRMTDIKNIYDCFDLGDRLYIMTIQSGTITDGGIVTDQVSAFKATPDGVVKTVMDTACTYMGSEESIRFEMIDDWLFCFTITGFESHQVSQLLMKQKID